MRRDRVMFTARPFTRPHCWICVRRLKRRVSCPLPGSRFIRRADRFLWEFRSGRALGLIFLLPMHLMTLLQTTDRGCGAWACTSEWNAVCGCGRRTDYCGHGRSIPFRIEAGGRQSGSVLQDQVTQGRSCPSAGGEVAPPVQNAKPAANPAQRHNAIKLRCCVPPESSDHARSPVPSPPGKPLPTPDEDRRRPWRCLSSVGWR
ncbi:hypothetical protein ACVW0A_000655 [Pseudomonas sp. TE3610]